MTFRPADKLQPMKPLSEYEQKVVRCASADCSIPTKSSECSTPAPEDTGAEFPPGEFVEHDLDAEYRLIAGGPSLRPKQVEHHRRA